ncbi:MAG: FAD:protein FMN transferase [Eubacterium sp.]|nr:FAD:protein FMN transferase [Eubacterium sp.]
MKKILSVLLCAVLLASLFGCGAVPQRFTYSNAEAFDTVTTFIAYTDSQESFDKGVKLLEGELLRYSKLFDIYKEFDGVTNLCTVNKTAAEKPVKVDKEIIELLKEGKEIYKESNGRLNICFGSVLMMWHAAREASTKSPQNAYVPKMRSLEKAAEHTNPDDLIIDEKNGTVFFKDDRLKLDVGATAKGFCTKKIAEYLKNNGVFSDFMLNIGGNVIACGYKKSDGKTKWNIQIQNPDTKSSAPLEALTLTDLSVVTSGDYQRYFNYKGRNFCHIIDTDTLMPAERFSGVTVICADSALADRLSTELFLMKLDEGRALVESLDGVEALWVDKSFNITYSSGFESYRAK